MKKNFTELYDELMNDIHNWKQARELENKYWELINTHDLFWIIRLLAKRLLKRELKIQEYHNDKTIIKENVEMIKEIINEVLDSEDERNDNENFYAVLDRLEIIKKLL